MVSGNKKFSNTHLSLVKGNTRTSDIQVLSFEKLDSENSLLLSDYLEIIGTKGSCSGALISAESWDIRPLIVEDGKLRIVRFFSPQSELQNEIKEYFSNLGTPEGFIEFGTCSQYSWVKRDFHKTTMLDDMATLTNISFSEKKLLCINLAKYLETLHMQGIIHGNLCIPNIAWNNQKPIFLDFGFSLFSEHKKHINSLSPELKNGFEATVASDIYGLGKVFERLIGDVQSLKLLELLSSMYAEAPEKRPSLEEVIDFFEDRKQVKAVDLLASDTKTKQTPESRLEDLSAKELPITSDNKNFNFYAGLFVLLLAFGYFYINKSGNEEIQEGIATHQNLSFPELWRSSQPSMMQIVAREAIVNNDRVAQALIIKDILDGKRPNNVNSQLLKLVFDPRWEASLTEIDRKIALTLATAGLFTDNMPALPSLESASPIVLLGIAGSLPVDLAVKDLANIKLKNMANLPIPLNLPFLELTKVKDISLDHTNARTLSHLVLGDVSEKMISAFFIEEKKDVDLFRMTRVLLPILSLHADFDNQLHAFLLTRSKVFAQVYRWFDEDNFADWQKVDKTARISIVAGLSPERNLTFEQYADLLKHPNPKVAKESAKFLNSTFYNEKQSALLDLLSSESNKLTRYQTISLLAALPLKGKPANDFYHKWFAAKPEHTSILELLIVRANGDKDDAFNLAAAQYLTDKEWKTTHAKLKKLVMHPETLARALAYSKLNKSKAEDLELLKTMAIAEPNPRLREQIQQIIKR